MLHSILYKQIMTLYDASRDPIDITKYQRYETCTRESEFRRFNNNDNDSDMYEYITYVYNEEGTMIGKCTNYYESLFEAEMNELYND